MTLSQLLIVGLLGGVLSIDAVSLAQTMVSRPIVASTIAGLAFGAPESGLLVGAMLEMLAMETMPFGASRYLEWSCGAVVGSVFVALQPELNGIVLVAALIFSLASAWMAGASMVVMRRINGRLVAARRQHLARGEVTVLPTLQAIGIVLDFARGSLMALVATVGSVQVGRVLTANAGMSDGLTSAILFAVPAAVALAACWRLFAAGSRRKYLLFLGAIVGTAYLVTA